MTHPGICTTCPNGQGRINVTAALEAFLARTGYPTLPAEVYLSLRCQQCDEYTAALVVQPEATVDQRTKSLLLGQLLKDVQTPPQAD
jgi:hypothetical protein